MYLDIYMLLINNNFDMKQETHIIPDMINNTQQRFDIRIIIIAFAAVTLLTEVDC